MITTYEFVRDYGFVQERGQ